MALTVKEIIDHAITLNNGASIDLMQGRRFINECMEMLSERFASAKVKDSIVITCNDTTIDYKLPNECLGVLDVKDSLSNTRVLSSYYVVNKYGEISFESTGPYKVEFLRSGKLPSRTITDLKLGDDIPEINQAYHRSIAYYVASMTLPLKDERTAAYMNESNILAEYADKTLNGMKKSQRKIKAPLWR